MKKIAINFSLFFPRIGKACVWSEWTLPVGLCTATHTRGVLWLCPAFDTKGTFVDLIFDLVASRCPIAVNTEGTKFLLTVAAYRPAMFMFSLRMFLTNVDFDG